MQTPEAGWAGGVIAFDLGDAPLVVEFFFLLCDASAGGRGPADFGGRARGTLAVDFAHDVASLAVEVVTAGNLRDGFTTLAGSDAAFAKDAVGALLAETWGSAS